METIEQTSVFEICPVYSVKRGIIRGMYDEVDVGITGENCPIDGQANKTKSIWIASLHFGKFVRSGEVFEKTAKRKCWPAEAEHLLGFGAKYPNEQCNYPIVALGSVFKNKHGEDCVLCLNKNIMTGKRTLNLWPLKSGFHDLFRFLAVEARGDDVMDLL